MLDVQTRHLATYQGQAIMSYTLSNERGYRLTVMNYGATILEYSVPNQFEQAQNIVLHYDKFEDYVQNAAKLGACIGPVAGRIQAGCFTLNGETYQLEKNHLGNHLHGGTTGFADTIFQVKDINQEAITFYIERLNGTGHYPGQVCVWVTYHLSACGEVRISYQAKSDQDTLFNPTNHTYFNLGKMSEPIDETFIRLQTSGYTVLASDNIPTGEIDSQAEFLKLLQQGVLFKELFKQTHAQLVDRNGLDHAFVLKTQAVIAELYHAKTNLCLHVRTDAPSIVIYTANGYEGNEPCMNGNKPFVHNGVALETQVLPDAIHHNHFRNIILRAGETFSSSTTYYAFNKM